MKYDPQRHHRRSIRLKGYDYSQAGAYFVTICAQDGQSLFGEVADGEMILNPAGEMVADIWQAIPEKFPTALLDAFVVMPNHIHFVIFLTNEPLSAESDPNTTVGVDPRVHPAPRPTPTSGGQTAAQEGETPMAEDPAGQTRGQTWGSGQTTELGQTGGQTGGLPLPSMRMLQARAGMVGK
jgi:putative transposase